MNEPYNFDKIIDRRGTYALKTDALQARYGNAGLIPLWVADMDFETPPCITDALRARLAHPVFGYTQESPGYRAAITGWQQRLHGWAIDPSWLSYIPGIVKGIGLALNVFTERGDKVIIQPPVYHPFRLVPQANGRTVINNPLKEIDGGYTMDFEQLAQCIDAGGKALILSNPHNPGGMVWTRATLERLAGMCAERGVLVISDEIHADMALFGHRHIPYATVSDAAAQHSITFGAPSKTFNIAGIVSSFAVVPGEAVRTRFYSWLKANELDNPHLFASIATEAAYTQGWAWRQALIDYLEENTRFIIRYLAEYIPAIRAVRPQASFLVWLDCRRLCLSHGALIDLFVRRAGLALNDGEMFGPGGSGFMRLNIGAPRSILEKALRQLRDAMAMPD
ncbi:MAG: PatB family C-S lyase [Prevotellaceae bacterium]|nr:PatB family C-S lyase [Prevotellaceae bacterium]